MQYRGAFLVAVVLIVPGWVLPQSAYACYLCCNSQHYLIEPATPVSGGTRFGGSGQAGFDIVINAQGGLASNAAALAAFNRAAAQWEARITDDMTVNITADLQALGSGILGSTSTSLIQVSYGTARTSMIADAANEASDDAIVNSLPATLTADLPSGFALDGNALMTRANGKALGLVGAGGTDATINFSTNFAFDYDSSDGITPGTFDFETVAAHEIGHALGFVSRVDFIDANSSGTVSPTLMDLFRFQNGVAGKDPSSAADFANFNRYLVPGGDAIFDPIFDIGGAERRLSTGRTKGDGNQASHWKADEQSGVTIGIMDPTLAQGVVFPANNNDFRLLDLIGYEINSSFALPEPSLFPIFLLGLGLIFRRGRRW